MKKPKQIRVALYQFKPGQTQGANELVGYVTRDPARVVFVTTHGITSEVHQDEHVVVELTRGVLIRPTLGDGSDPNVWSARLLHETKLPRDLECRTCGLQCPTCGRKA